MKHHLLSLLFLLTAVTASYAVPAKPGKVQYRQPDGTQVTLVLHGDEFSHITTTSDNYTVVRTASGYQYVVKKQGLLVPSGIIAHDVADRSADEKAFLSANAKMLRADITAETEQSMRRSRSLWNAPAKGGEPQKAPHYNYEKFHGLVILVEWNDLSFTRSDAKAFFSSMMNDENYSGYYDKTNPQKWVECTGSVHDYFRDNSMGRFQPTFDVVGPVKINRSHTYPKGASNGWQCAVDAIEAANSIVDYSKYDTDGDGVVDMFYIIYAGYGSNVGGNSSDYIWPYASYYAYSYRTYDGVRMGRYACSTEICDYEGSGTKTLDGIGTICHEFSHVLGLPDLYDTDYEENGQSNDPGVWSIMAGGSYNNNSRTPTGYGTYERYSIGFMQPEIISEEGDGYTLEALNESNKAYRINSSVDKEYFILENRQKTKWDEYLPGSGMLIFRVDSTNSYVWDSNTANCNPKHNYFEMVRANPRMVGEYITPSAYDPFPGLGGVIAINNETEPSLRSWAGKPTPLSLNTIQEAGGIISFNVGGAEVDAAVEDFEAMELTETDAAGVQGVFCKWDMVNSHVMAATDTYGTGSKALGIARGGSLTSSVMEKGVTTLEYDFWNVTSTSVMIRTEYSVDGGATWTRLKTVDGKEQIQVQKGKSLKVKYIVSLPAGAMYRISQTSGLPTQYNCIDNIAVMFNDLGTGIAHVPSGTDAEAVQTTVYNLAGQCVSPDAKGFVIVKTRTADGRVVTKKLWR